MNTVARLLVGIAAGTALISTAAGLATSAAVAAPAPAAAPAPTAPATAAAATGTTFTVSTRYGSPHKGETSSDVRALQLRLVKAKLLKKKHVTAYFGTLTEQAVTGIQREQGLTANGRVTKATWRALVDATGTITIKQTTKKNIAKRCKVAGRVLCVDKTTDKLYFMENGRIWKTVDARFGCAGMRTREGTFAVQRKSRHHVSSIYHTPMPYAMFFSGGQAVHYSADFAARGYAGCSHGCVNVRAKSAVAWMFEQVRVGDRVVVYRS